jgi:hypothetical protein
VKETPCLDQISRAIFSTGNIYMARILALAWPISVAIQVHEYMRIPLLLRNVMVRARVGTLRVP